MAMNDNMAAEISAAGAVKPLVSVLSKSTIAIRGNAVGLLYRLTFVSKEVKDKMVEAKVIGPTVPLLGEDFPKGVRGEEVGLLYHLSISGPLVCEEIAAVEGVVRKTVPLMDSRFPEPVQAAAVGLLYQIFSANKDVQVEIAAAGVVTTLAKFVHSSDKHLFIPALGLLHKLATSSKKARAEIAAAGIIARMVEFVNPENSGKYPKEIEGVAAGVLFLLEMSKIN
jgi:hypothetical protein